MSVGLMLIGLSVVLHFGARIIAGLLAVAAESISVAYARHLVNAYGGIDVQPSINPPHPSDSSEHIVAGVTGLHGSHQVQCGVNLAEDYFVADLTDGKIVKLDDVEKQINAKYNYMPAAVLNGFMRRMTEYVDCGDVVILNIKTEGVVFIHRKYSGAVNHPPYR